MAASAAGVSANANGAVVPDEASAAVPSPELQELVGRIIEAITGHLSSERLKGELRSLSPQNLTTLFQHVSREIVKMDDPLKASEALGDLFTLEQVEQASKDLLKAHGSAVEAAQKLVGAAKFFFKHTETNSNKIQLEHLFQKAMIACGSVIVALGVRDLFEQPDGSYDAYFKMQKFFLVIGAYQLLSQSAIDLLGPRMGVVVARTLFCTIEILDLVYPLISPFPHNLLNEVQNWTYEAKCGDLPRVEGRAKEKAQIATHLKNGENVLVVGKSGVGKTKMLQSFVYDLLDKKFRGLSPDLCVFYVNAARLIDSGSYNNDLQVFDRIIAQMGRHSKKVVLVVDEIQALYEPTKEGYRSVLSQQLLTLLDPDTGPFDNFIGITTDIGYHTMIGQAPQSRTAVNATPLFNQFMPKPQVEGEGSQGSPSGLLELDTTQSRGGEHSHSHTPTSRNVDSLEGDLGAHEPTDRRFQKVHVWSATREDVLSVLAAHILRKSPEVACYPAELRYLVDEVDKRREFYHQTEMNAKEPKEPECSLQVLREALSMLSTTNCTQLEKDVNMLHQQLYALDALNSLAFSLTTDHQDHEGKVKERDTLCEDLQRLYFDGKVHKPRELLHRLSEKLAMQQKEALNLHKKMEQFLSLRRALHHAVCKVAKISAEVLSKDEEVSVKRFMILSNFVNVAMYTHLEASSNQQTDVHAILDRNLVNKSLKKVLGSPSPSPILG